MKGKKVLFMAALVIIIAAFCFAINSVYADNGLIGADFNNFYTALNCDTAKFYEAETLLSPKYCDGKNKKAAYRQRGFTYFSDNDISDFTISNFNDLKTALLNAKESEPIIYSGIIEGDLTVNYGTTLIISSKALTTINADANLTVMGTLIVGGSQNTPSIEQKTDHILALNGSITVEKSGIMKVFCPISGSGEIIVYGKFYEPLYIADYISEDFFNNGRISGEHFNRWALVIAKVKRTFYQTAEYNGYIYTDVLTEDIMPIVKQSGLFCINSGKVVFDYDSQKAISAIIGDFDYQNIGKTKISLFGDVAIKPFSFVYKGKIYPTNSGFSFSYNFDLAIYGSVKIEENAQLKILPGASVCVKSGASLTVDGGLYAYEAFLSPQLFMQYPESDILFDYGFDKCGVIKVDGSLYINGGLTGVICSDNLGAKIVTSKSAVLKKR